MAAITRLTSIAVPGHRSSAFPGPGAILKRLTGFIVNIAHIMTR